MATNYDNLKTELQALANACTDDITKYRALIVIDQYIAALEQQASSTSTDIQSYSIGGRSVTRREGTGYQETVARLWNELNELLYGNITYADFRKNFAEDANGLVN